MKPTLLVITVDVQEEDRTSSTSLSMVTGSRGNLEIRRGATTRPRNDNFSQGIPSFKNSLRLSHLQGILSNWHVPATYLVSDAVSRNEHTAAMLKSFAQNERCEIGALLLPENTPPYSLTSADDSEEMRQIRRMCCNLPVALLRRKIQTLTRSIKQKLEIQPTSFRAGHWSFSSELASCLLDCGYLVDSSITPGIAHRSTFGPDYSVMPYFDFSRDICELVPVKSIGHSSAHRLAELPPTIFSCEPDARVKAHSAILRNVILNCFKGKKSIQQPKHGTWLSPSTSSLKEMKQVVDSLIEQQVSVLTLHLSSNACTKENFPGYLGRTTAIVHYMLQRSCQPTTISQAAHILSEERNAPATSYSDIGRRLSGNSLLSLL
ncbi:MAG: hypothetical protein PHC51_05705 [bacterium]|nr:hypothetical protein [bacterium]